MLAHKEFGVERLGPGAEPGDGDDLTLLGEVDHDRRHPGDIDQIALQHAERQAGRTPGVDRVAAGLQNVEPGGRGEVMAGGDRVAGHGDRRAVRERFGHGEALLAYVAFCRAHSSA